MPHFLRVLLTWQCNVRGNGSKTQGQRHVRLFIESLSSSGRSYLKELPLCCRMFHMVPGSEIVGSVELRKCKQEKKPGGNFLFPFFPPRAPFRPPFSLAPPLSHLPYFRAFPTIWEPGTGLVKGWKGKMYFKVGPQRLLEEPLWKIHGHNNFFWE